MKENKHDEKPEPIEAKDEMNNKEMDVLLKELHSTAYWKALKRLMLQNMINAENALFTIDAFKEPTEAARNQGKRMGIFAVESYVDQLANKNKEDEDDAPIY